jgi:hypothetical protein
VGAGKNNQIEITDKLIPSEQQEAADLMDNLLPLEYPVAPRLYLIEIES